MIDLNDGIQKYKFLNLILMSILSLRGSKCNYLVVLVASVDILPMLIPQVQHGEGDKLGHRSYKFGVAGWFIDNDINRAFSIR